MKTRLIDRLWLPVVLGLSTVMFSLILLQRQLAQQKAESDQAMRAQAQLVKNTVESELKSRIQPLELLGQRWRLHNRDGVSEDDFESDTVAMLGYPAYQATEWADSTLHVRRIEPEDANGAELGFDLGAGPQMRQVLHFAADTGAVAVSHPVNLRKGGQGLLVCVPVNPNSKSGGYLIGVFRYQDLFNSILHGVVPDYAVAVYDADTQIYSSAAAGPPPRDAQVAPVHFQQLTWQLQAWPVAETSVYPHSALPQLTFVLALVLATWITFAAYAAETERFRAKEVAEANKDLKREIAGREQAEQALLESQKMEAVGRLAGGVAHDFNNLLMVIRGHAALLLNRMSAENPRRREVSDIVRTTDRASTLTRQLLALGRKQVLKPRVLSLNNLVTQVSTLLPAVLGVNVNIVMHLDPDLGRVRADSSQLEQIIMNLVFNARDAMQGGGELTIYTANVSLDESWFRTQPDLVPGPFVMLAVHDTGCGMDSETQSHIFEPFFTTKDSGKGSGLGLSAVYGTVRQSGGCINVSSKLGEGTSVQIYLPRVEEEIESVETPPEPAAPAGGVETILVVEDDDAVRRMTREFLAIAGYTVVEARSAADALSLLEDDNIPVDLLLTDVVMPGMKGSELGEALARIDPDMRVLYMSAYTEDAVVNFGYLGSTAAFIEKPFSPEELARKVREVLASPKDGSRAKHVTGA